MHNTSILKFPTIEAGNLNNKDGSFTYNYLLGVVMLYMMFMILSGITVYKIIQIGWFILPAGILVAPFIYSLSNVTTEVYGYSIGRNMMWWFIFTSTIFTIFGFFLSHLPSPSTFKHQEAFNLILGDMPIVYFAGILGSIIGLSFNNIIVSKLKAKMDGKRYWVRSILSTCAGEITYNLVAYPIMLIWNRPLKDFIYLLICATSFKIIVTAIIWPFECFLARFLKQKENIDIINYHINYDIFQFKIEPNNRPSKPMLKLIK